MHRHPVVRGGVVPRAASLVFGLFLFALGIVLILESKLGLSPWDVLNQGISRHTPLSFGMANVAVGVVVLFVGWSLGGVRPSDSPRLRMPVPASRMSVLPSDSVSSTHDVLPP